MIKRMVFKVGSIARRALQKRPDLRQAKRICIFKVGAIGDVLMTTPLVRAIRARFPNAHIEYWVGQWSAPVLKGNPRIDKVIGFDEKAILKRSPLAVHRLVHAIRRQHYDVMFVLDFSYLANLFAAWCKVPIRIGFDRNGEGFANTLAAPYGKRVHDIDSYLGIARLIGVKNPSQRMELFLTPAEEHLAKVFFKKHQLVPGKTICIAPGGAKNPGMTLNIKRWPAERFAAAAEALTRKGWQILLIGGPDDVEAARIVRQRVAAVDATGEFPLRMSAALIKQCAWFICNDSGPMHLSTAIGTPTVAIFGPTDPKKLAPQGTKCRILWKHPGRKPCYLDGALLPCPDKHACINRVTVTDVIRVVR